METTTKTGDNIMANYPKSTFAVDITDFTVYVGKLITFAEAFLAEANLKLARARTATSKRRWARAAEHGEIALACALEGSKWLREALEGLKDLHAGDTSMAQAWKVDGHRYATHIDNVESFARSTVGTLARWPAVCREVSRTLGYELPAARTLTK